VRRRPEPHNLRPKRNPAIVPVVRFMVEGDVKSHKVCKLGESGALESSGGIANFNRRYFIGHNRKTFQPGSSE